jgi:inhibitor of Bruton tyrosine kinase
MKAKEIYDFVVLVVVGGALFSNLSGLLAELLSRLGPGQHTQYNFTPLPQFSYTIASVTLGQDHTLALTTSGEVMSWGLNRFSQLGYIIEPTASDGFAKSDEPIQPTPRKVQGALRKITVLGVAATKSASACWTETDVFTWGTNNGQLGRSHRHFYFYFLLIVIM